MRLLGEGKAKDFTAEPGETLLEKGRQVFAVPDNYFCHVCDGNGCGKCRFTGKEEERQLRKKQRGKA